MDSGASASYIHKFYVNKKKLLRRRHPRKSGPQRLDLFLCHARPKLCQKISELDVTDHISVQIHVTTNKRNYKVIFGRDLLRELEIRLDSQNNIIGWQDINLPMKPIDCKMRTHFTIQDSKNVRHATKRMKKILGDNYEKANLKKILNNLKYLNNDLQS